MQVVRFYEDLSAFGIVPVTITHGGFSYQWPFDLTVKGKKALEMAYNVKELVLRESFHPGLPEDPHVGSIMLAQGMFPFVSLYALLNDGAIEVYLTTDQRLSGIYRGEFPALKDMFLNYYQGEVVWRFKRVGTQIVGVSGHQLDDLLD
ncbi:MAG: hypothetical protein ACYC3X_27700 [Pirellulaceae bacterium]